MTLDDEPEAPEARRAGLRAGDQLLAVDGLPVRSRGRARQLLTGPASDIVVMVARALDLRWSVRVRRERIH